MSSPRAPSFGSRRMTTARRICAREEKAEAMEETLDSIADKVMNGSLTLPIAVTINESVRRQNDQTVLPAGSLLWIVRFHFNEVAQFQDEFGRNLEESVSYRQRRFELLSGQLELDGVEFKTLGDALGHTPRPKQLSCLSSWSGNQEKCGASLGMNEVIKVLDTSERGEDGCLYHNVQRMRNFVEQGDPVRIPVDEEITFSTSFCGENGFLLSEIIALKKHHVLSFPLRVRLLDENGYQRTSRNPKYTLCSLTVERSFVVRVSVSDTDGDFDTMCLPLGTTPVTVQMPTKGDASSALKTPGKALRQEEVDSIFNLPRLGPPSPGGFPPCRPKLLKEVANAPAQSQHRPHSINTRRDDEESPLPPLSHPRAGSSPVSTNLTNEDEVYEKIDAVLASMPSSASVPKTTTLLDLATGLSEEAEQSMMEDKGYNHALEGETPYAAIDFGTSALTASPSTGSSVLSPSPMTCPPPKLDIPVSYTQLKFDRGPVPYDSDSDNQSMYMCMAQLEGADAIVRRVDISQPSTDSESETTPPLPPKLSSEQGAHYWKWKYEQLQKKLTLPQDEDDQDQRHGAVLSQSSSLQGGSEQMDPATFEKSYQQLADQLAKSEAARKAAESKLDEIVKILLSVCGINLTNAEPS